MSRKFLQRTAGESRYTVRELGDGGSSPWRISRWPGRWVVVHQDITGQKRAEIEIAHMAHHDALTNLPNRLLLRERLEEALAHVPAAGNWRCSTSTSIISRASTTRSGMPSATNCSKRSPAGCTAAFGSRTPSRGSAATSFAIIQTGFGQLSEVAGLASRIREVSHAL